MTEPVRGMGLVLVLRHKPICIAIILCKHACKEVCDVKPGLPMALTGSVVEQMIARYHNFYRL